MPETNPRMHVVPPHWGACDLCEKQLLKPCDRLYLVPSKRPNSNSDLALCPACLAKRGYTQTDVKAEYRVDEGAVVGTIFAKFSDKGVESHDATLTMGSEGPILWEDASNGAKEVEYSGLPQTEADIREFIANPAKIEAWVKRLETRRADVARKLGDMLKEGVLILGSQNNRFPWLEMRVKELAGLLGMDPAFE